MTPKIFCAIDTADMERALGLVRQLSALPLHFKLGLEFFIAQGIAGVEKIREASGGKADIFLDLKLHDIPKTVERAVRAAGAARPQFLTIHASGGRTMMEAAIAAAQSLPQKPKILAVTVLTHLDQKDLIECGQMGPIAAQVNRLAHLAAESGADGVVCSPREITTLQQNFGKNFLLVVPGIRPEGTPPNDQKRTMTPKQALALGANYLVIGRPITEAPDPVAVAKSLLAD
jgi:orotidine-5'-phosphate decarboxylase